MTQRNFHCQNCFTQFKLNCLSGVIQRQLVVNTTKMKFTIAILLVVVAFLFSPIISFPQNRKFRLYFRDTLAKLICLIIPLILALVRSHYPSYFISKHKYGIPKTTSAWKDAKRQATKANAKRIPKMVSMKMDVPLRFVTVEEHVDHFCFNQLSTYGVNLRNRI